MDELRTSIREAFRHVLEPIEFRFHSCAPTEDGTAQQMLFDGSDGHTYACTIPVNQPGSACLRRVD